MESNRKIVLTGLVTIVLGSSVIAIFLQVFALPGGFSTTYIAVVAGVTLVACVFFLAGIGAGTTADELFPARKKR